MNVESSPKRRGVNAGLMQNFSTSLLGTTLAPLVLPWLADHDGWRTTFYFCGGLLSLFLRETAPGKAQTARAS